MPGPLPYDPAALAELQAVNPDDRGAFVVELIDLFLRDTPPLLEAIARAEQTRDSTLAGRSAHSIKGSAGNFGAGGVTDLARAIETAAKANDWPQVAATLPLLRQAFAELASALRQVPRPQA